MIFFFFQAEDGIRDRNVTGVQTCALPIYKLLTIKTLLDSELLADVLREGILVNHEVHSLVSYESLGHVPGSLVVTILAPRVWTSWLTRMP